MILIIQTNQRRLHLEAFKFADLSIERFVSVSCIDLQENLQYEMIRDILFTGHAVILSIVGFAE